MNDKNILPKDEAATPVHPKTTEMPRPQSRVLQDLHSYRIADSGIRKSLIKSLYPRYAFSAIEALIVACILQDPEKTWTDLNLLQGLDDHFAMNERADFDVETLNDALSRLVRDGFLIKGGMVRCNYGLSGEALEAFAHDRPFGCPAAESDNAAFLKRMTPEDYLKVDALSYIRERFAEPTRCLGLEKYGTREQRLFWMLAGQLLRQGANPIFGKALRSLYEDADAVLALASPLIRDGLLVSVPSMKEDARADDAGLLLSVRAAKALFHGCDAAVSFTGISRYATVTPWTEIAKKTLYYSDGERERMDFLRTMLSADQFARAQRRLEGRKRNPAIQILLYGPPGTGKTETARQLALETGRHLIRVDVSKLLYSSWGDAEKCYQALFREYEYLSAVSERAPILLLNEADNLLSRRLSCLERAIDKGENTLTTLLLQGFEEMSGILIATTNCADLLDEAFSRRFLYKIELGVPDAGVRAQMWLDAFPTLRQEEVDALAAEFDLSGAQIDNVAVKWDLAEPFLQERDFRFLRRLCREESGTGKAGRGGNKIGF